MAVFSCGPQLGDRPTPTSCKAPTVGTCRGRTPLSRSACTTRAVATESRGITQGTRDAVSRRGVAAAIPGSRRSRAAKRRPPRTAAATVSSVAVRGISRGIEGRTSISRYPGGRTAPLAGTRAISIASRRRGRRTSRGPAAGPTVEPGETSAALTAGARTVSGVAAAGAPGSRGT